MAVMRVHKTADYTVMSNRHFKEKEMSLKAKGLLSMMLSLPDDWDYSIAGLVVLSKDGKDSVMNTLTELEQFGYLKRTRITNEKGQFSGYDYDIYENPVEEEPQEGKPYAGKPNTANPQQLNTNKSNIKELKTKEKKKVSKPNSFDEIITVYAMKFENPVCDEISNLLGEWLKVRKAKRAAMTDTAIQLNINKLDRLAEESGMTVNEYLQEVICRGWAAFFKINDYSKKEEKKPEPKEPIRYGGTYL